MAGLPAWEIPFNALGKIILAVPEDLYKVAKDVTEANAVINTDLPQFVAMLDDAAVAISDKFINIQMDVQVGKDFLALLASIKAQLGVKAAAAPAAKG